MSDSKTTLLIVDDEPFNLDILQEHLEDEGFDIITAEDGPQALDVLMNTDSVISTILLDRMMPGMDGIEVLKKIKSEPEYKHIPVIMQTAAASDTDVIEGLEAGAFYYLTKPFEPELVVTVVNSALTDYENFLKSKESSNETDELMPLVHNLSVKLKTIEEAHYVVGRIANVYPEPDRVLLGMSELLVNAVEHGNLGITYDEKSELLTNNTWKQEIEKRLTQSPYKERAITVEIKKTDSEIVLVIEDEGEGFDWQSFIEMDSERAYDSHGRGIAMANMVSFDSVTYNDVGNKVTCVSRLD